MGLMNERGARKGRFGGRAKRGQVGEGETGKVRNGRGEIKRRWEGREGKEGHGAKGRESGKDGGMSESRMSALCTAND